MDTKKLSTILRALAAFMIAKLLVGCAPAPQTPNPQSQQSPPALNAAASISLTETTTSDLKHLWHRIDNNSGISWALSNEPLNGEKIILQMGEYYTCGAFIEVKDNQLILSDLWGVDNADGTRTSYDKYMCGDYAGAYRVLIDSEAKTLTLVDDKGMYLKFVQDNTL